MAGGVVITGKEFGEFDFSEPGSETFKSELIRLRGLAKEFYNSLRRDVAKNPDIGGIRFSKLGKSKSFSNSANYKKLLLFPKIKELLSSGVVISKEANRDRNKHPNIDFFYTLQTTAVIEGQPYNVTMTVYQDNRGNFYYNHGLFNGNEKTPTPIRELEPGNQELRYTASAEALNNTVPQDGEKGKDDLAVVSSVIMSSRKSGNHTRRLK